jgi:hypothetical protein
MVWGILEKLIVTQLAKKFPAFMESKVYYLVHKDATLDNILSQFNPLYFLAPYFP